jgi:hypothetical protein
MTTYSFPSFFTSVTLILSYKYKATRWSSSNTLSSYSPRTLALHPPRSAGPNRFFLSSTSTLPLPWFRKNHPFFHFSKVTMKSQVALTVLVGAASE